MTAKSRQRPHPFVRDHDVPPDMDGRGACRCGLVGEPGDAHHDVPPAPEQAEARRWAGEREDD